MVAQRQAVWWQLSSHQQARPHSTDAHICSTQPLLQVTPAGSLQLVITGCWLLGVVKVPDWSQKRRLPVLALRWHQWGLGWAERPG